MRGINRRGGTLMWTQNIIAVELGRGMQLASRMTALWVATVLAHCPWLGSQFQQSHRALVHGQLRLEHDDKIEQGNRDSCIRGMFSVIFCCLWHRKRCWTTIWVAP
jgi:hypothetical protein